MKNKIGFFLMVLIAVLGPIGIYNGYAQSLQDYELQIQDLERFGNSYFAAYTNLFSSNFGFSLNQGWSGGEIPERAGQVSISLVGSSAVIPIGNSNRFIATNQLYQASGVQLAPLTPGLFTDASGGSARFFLLDPTTHNRLVNPVDGSYLSADVNLLDGLGTDLGVTPFVMPQIGVSLGKSTEVILRLMPFDVGISNGKLNVSAYGGAVRHNISQWFSDRKNTAFSVNLLLSYMKNNVHFTPNGNRFLVFSNDFLNTSGTDLELKHQTHTQQVLLFFNYRLSDFLQIYAHGGAVNQSSDLGSTGQFKINIDNRYISDVAPDDNGLDFPNVFSSRLEKTVAEGGAGIQFGSGVFQAEMQYTYANTHIASLGLRVNLFRKTSSQPYTKLIPN